MRQFRPTLLGALVLTLLLASCAPAGETPPAATPTPAATPAAPAASPTEESAGILSLFSATDLDGNDIDQSIFADYDLTMINVWATFCSPCIQEMPELGELAGTYADKGVRVVGLISDVLDTNGAVSESQLDVAREIVETTGAGYLHIVPSEDLYGLLSQIDAVPTTFFVDAAGEQVGQAYLGARSGEEWAAILDDLLAEAAP